MQMCGDHVEVTGVQDEDMHVSRQCYLLHCEVKLLNFNLLE